MPTLGLCPHSNATTGRVVQRVSYGSSVREILLLGRRPIQPWPVQLYGRPDYRYHQNTCRHSVFIHVHYRIVAVFVAAGFIWLLIMIYLTLGDYLTR
jgi:hypothetical protein